MSAAVTPSAAAVGSSGVIVMPGDIIDASSERRVRLSTGLIPTADGVVAAAGGVIRRGGHGAGVGGNALLWVDNVTRRYHPQVGDQVVGTIVEKHAESYKVDIGLSQPAVLPALAFEGASKRNKPNLDVGKLMYMLVRVANKHIEVELTCISPHIKKDWVNQDSVYGPLEGGYVINTTIAAARALMDDNHPVLALLAKKIPFELSVGANGRVWVRAAVPTQTIVVANVLQLGETRSVAQLEVMLDRAIKAWNADKS